MRSRFDDFVTARGGVLWRTAWLLTGHGDRAEELLGRALARVWSLGQDDRTAPGGFDDEALAALVRAYLPRREADESPTGSADSKAAAEPAWTADDAATVQERHEMLTALGLLTPRQRAVVVLVHGERRTLAEVATLLGTRAEIVERVHADARAVLRETPLGAGEERLQAGLARVPAPPYAPTRALDAETRARRGRRRTMLAAGAVGIGLLALLMPAIVDGLAADDPASTSAAASQRRLVDPLPIPPRCVDLDGEPPAPELSLDLDQASVAWLRFCGSPTGAPGDGLSGLSLTTTVVGDLDPVVAPWVARQGLVPCPFQRPVDDGSVRLQLGTRDGQTHVVDLVVGRCGDVLVDGVRMAVDGRTVFADALGALGAQLVDDRSDSVRPVPGRPRCPVDPMRPDAAGRVTIADYPKTAGLPLPLPAVRALVCRYAPDRQPPPRLVESFPVSAADAEQIRAAYLANGQSPRVGCVHYPRAAQFAVVLVDETGSWRAFGLDTGGCDALAGPDSETGYAGHWLVEQVRYAVPACEEVPGGAIRLEAAR